MQLWSASLVTSCLKLNRSLLIWCNSGLLISMCILKRAVMVIFVILNSFNMMSGIVSWLLVCCAELLSMCGWRLCLRRLWHAIIFLLPASPMVGAEMSRPSSMLVWNGQIKFSKLCTQHQYSSQWNMKTVSEKKILRTYKIQCWMWFCNIIKL